MSAEPTLTLKSSLFRQEREAAWRELERMLAAAEKKGLRALTAADLHRLPILYRGAVSSLSVARAISLDRNLLDYLEALVSRAYLCLYSNHRFGGEVLRDFFRSRFPGAAALLWRPCAAAAAVLLAGTLCGFLLTLEDLERYPAFVPEEMAQGRNPSASTESLRKVLYHGTGSANGLTLFASYLFTHNAKIAMLCFCLGFAAGVPVVILLFYNGLILGAMTALYHSRGLGGEFLAWILGHGVTELWAVILCGGAGLVLAGGLLFPGRRARLDSLARAGRTTAPLVVGAVMMLLAAAGLEGYFRQLVPHPAARWAVAGGTLFFWSWYLHIHGRRHAVPRD